MSKQLRVIPQGPAGSRSGSKLPPAQRRFNRLVQDIEVARARLHAWQEEEPRFRERHRKEILPLLEKERALHREWLLALDRAAIQRNWSKADTRTLQRMIHEQVLMQLDVDPHDVEMRAVFTRNSGDDYGEYQRRDASVTRDIMQETMGVDLGDESFADEEAVLARVDERLREQAQQREDEEVAARDADWERERARQSGHAEQSRASAAEARRRAEVERTTQSVRDVYHKLVSALHPDREPDAERRLAKTAMMQKVNEAYEKNDLLTLLEAQLQLQQLDATALGTLDRATLARYNRVLAEQLAELTEALADAELAFMLEFNVGQDRRLKTANLGGLIEQARKDIRATTRELTEQMAWMREPARMRAWLKFDREAERERERSLRRTNAIFSELFEMSGFGDTNSRHAPNWDDDIPF